MNASPLTRGRSLLFSDNVPAKLSRRCRQKAEGKPWCWWIRAPCWAAAWWSPPSKQFRTFSAGSRIEFAFFFWVRFWKAAGWTWPRLVAEGAKSVPLPGFPVPDLGAQILSVPRLGILQQAVITPSCCWWVGSGDADRELSGAGNLQSSSRPPKVTQKKSLLIKHSQCFISPMNWKYCKDDPCLNFGCILWALVTPREMTVLGNINLCVKTATKATHTT